METAEWMEAPRSYTYGNESSPGTDTGDAEPYSGGGGTARQHRDSSDRLSDSACTTRISETVKLPCSKGNRNAPASSEVHAQAEGTSDCDTASTGTIGIPARTCGSKVPFTTAVAAGGGPPGSTEPLTHSSMSHILLRHFSKAELTSTRRLIECETLLETSLTESIDETTTKLETLQHVRGPLTREQQVAKFEECHSERLKAANAGGKNQNWRNKNKFVSNTSATAKRGCKQEIPQLVNDCEDAHIFHNTEEQRYLFKKSVPSHALIESQGEVQRWQEDNNEVTLEKTVPKPSENNQSVPTTRTNSLPTLLNQSATISSVLENANCFDPTEFTSQNETSIAALSQQRKILPQSGFPNPGFAIYSGDTGTAPRASTADTSVLLQTTHGLSEPRWPCGTKASAFPASDTVQVCCVNPSNLLPKITQGEKMTQILKEQTDQLKMEVEDFSKCMTEETFLLQDDYLALNQLKRYLDALERNYLTAREEHHNLQLQYYKDKSISIGEFDPERKVEGEIFRLGTLLSDIEEQADDMTRRWAPSLTSCESAHSSCSLWESSVLSSVTDSPEENAFHPNNKEGENTSQTSYIIPQKNAHFSLERDKCNLHIHTLQKRAESTYKKERDTLGKSCLLASKYSSNVTRFFSSEGKYEAEGLGFHTQGTLSQKDSASEESMKGSKTCKKNLLILHALRNNIQERKTGIRTIFRQRKPTDLSDTNLSSDSEDILAYHSYGSQSNEFMKRESYKTFHTRLHGERKGFQCRCPRESQNQFKHRTYKESVHSCALCRNKSSGSTSYSQKIIPTQKSQTNQQPPELVNRLPERNSARNTSVINTRNRNAKDFNINILNSTLDHAIQTANRLKKATERMVQAISEDLAKAARKQL